jgi:hypothetical protein
MACLTQEVAGVHMQLQGALGLAGCPYSCPTYNCPTDCLHHVVSLTDKMRKRTTLPRLPLIRTRAVPVAMPPDMVTASCCKSCAAASGCASQTRNVTALPATAGVWSSLWVGNCSHPAVGTKQMEQSVL